jgi:hypothetical protein
MDNLDCYQKSFNQAATNVESLNHLFVICGEKVIFALHDLQHNTNASASNMPTIVLIQHQRMGYPGKFPLP